MLPGCHCAEGPASSSPGRDGDCLQARGGAWRPPRLCREEAEGAGPCIPVGGRAGLHGVPGPAGVWGQPTDADRRRPGGQIATGRADPEARCRGAEGACPPREAQTADPTDRAGVHLGTGNGGGGGWRPPLKGPPSESAWAHTGTLTCVGPGSVPTHATHTPVGPHTCSHAHRLTHRPSRTDCGLWAPPAGGRWRWPATLRACVRGPVTLVGLGSGGAGSAGAGHGDPHHTPGRGGGEVPAHPQSPEETPRWAARMGLGGGAGVDPTRGSWGSPSSLWLYQALLSCRCSEGSSS